jgi:hypothetical protein
MRIDVICRPDSVLIKDFDMSSAGWFEELTYSENARATVYTPIGEGSLSFHKTTALANVKIAWKLTGIKKIRSRKFNPKVSIFYFTEKVETKLPPSTVIKTSV